MRRRRQLARALAIAFAALAAACVPAPAPLSEPPPPPPELPSPPAPKPEPQPPPPAPEETLGLDRAAVIDMLGGPSLVTRAPPAEIWLYRGRACVLHLFFYDSEDGATYRVRHVETSPPSPDGGPVDRVLCFAEFLLPEIAPSGAGAPAVAE